MSSFRVCVMLSAVLLFTSFESAADTLVVPETIFASGFEAAVPGSPTPFSETPTNGAVLHANDLPEIGIAFEPPAAGVPSYSLLVDGVDVSSHVTLIGNRIAYQPEHVLPEGAHAIAATIGSNPYYWTFNTRTLPEVVGTAPHGYVGPVGSRPTLSASFIDVGSGIAASETSLQLDGTDVTALSVVTADTITFPTGDGLSQGEHVATLRIADIAGNDVSTTWRFVVGGMPVITGTLPADAMLPFGSRPAVGASFSLQEIGALDPEQVRLFLNDEDITDLAQIVMHSPQAGEIRFEPTDALNSGSYAVYLEVGSTLGVSALAEWRFGVDVLREYQLGRTSPADGSTVYSPSVTVKATASSNIGVPLELSVNGQHIASHQLNGSQIAFEKAIRLQPGSNDITIQAVFPDGVQRELQSTVVYDAPAIVNITSPADFSSHGPLTPGLPTAGGAQNLTGAVERPIVVSGTTSGEVVGVTVNQQSAQLGPDGKSFAFDRFFAHEGTNLISVSAIDSRGRVSTAHVTVFVDQTAPLLSVETPGPDFVTSESHIDVNGIVDDAVEALINTPQPVVLVENDANGSEVFALVADRYFNASQVPLEIGRNQLTVTASDQHGNVRSQQIDLVRVAVGSKRLTSLSGNAQTALVGQELPDPFVVAAINSDGLPIAGLPVHFQVQRGSGTLHSEGASVGPDGVNPARSLSVLTDAAGRAAVWLTLGSDAGPASNRVRAWSEIASEEVLFSATASRGVVSQVGAFGSTGMQYVETNSAPMEALTAIAVDSAFNGVPEVSVRFQIEAGDATFDSGPNGYGEASADRQSILIPTDKVGLASARPRIGNQPGLIRISAEAILEDGTRVGGALFQIMALERGSADTSFSGTVQDHVGVPVAGVRLSIGRTNMSVLTGEDGTFLFEGQVPPGKIDLFVDGREVNIVREGRTLEYPALHFETNVIQGIRNQLPHFIQLPPVDTSQSRIVGGNEDVTLTVPGFDGFEMLVKANSVTFPDGSRVGPLVVTPVHNDRLPMVPPGIGAAFGTIGWTIQPSGTRFDPPIEVRIPNVAGMRPGETAPLVQWDHDLSTFVPMGQVTVNESGTLLVSDARTGLTKAGWGGCTECPPPPPNCVMKTPECGVCEKLVSQSGSCAVCKPKTSAEVSADFQIIAPSQTFYVETDQVDSSIDFATIDTSGLDGEDFDWDVRTAKTRQLTADVSLACGSSSRPLELAVGDGFTVHMNDTQLGLHCNSSPCGPAPPHAAGDINIIPQHQPGIPVTTQDGAAAVFVCPEIEGGGIKKEITGIGFKARNPQIQTLKDYVRSIESNQITSEALIHFACHEPNVAFNGRYQHFNTSGPVEGLPVLNDGNDGGFGVMQVTDAAERSCAALWDWRKNVDAGQRIFQGKVTLASGTHLDEANSGRANTRLRECLAASGQNWSLVARELSAEQRIFEAIRRNNGGRQYKWYITDGGGHDNNGPYNQQSRCDIGEWRRYLSVRTFDQVGVPQREYVEDVCNCETPMAGVTCPDEPN